MVPEDGTSRFKGITSATKVELRTRSSRVRPDDIFGPNPSGSPEIDVADFEQRIKSFTKQCHKIGMWNVRSLYAGKLDVVLREMTRAGVKLLGLSEVRWESIGHFQSGKYKMFYSEQPSTRKNGVASHVTKT